MAVSEGFTSFVLEQLEPVTRVSIRRMFGGAGIYAGPYFFALIIDDRLYFKVDDSNRPDYAAAGMSPFQYEAKGLVTLQYYEVPGDVLEDTQTLGEWVRKSVAVAKTKAKSKATAKPAKKKSARKKVAG